MDEVNVALGAAENNTASGNNGGGFNNVLHTILGNGGIGSVASGAGDIICAIKGNCQPDSVTYVNQAPTNNNSMILLIGGGLVVAVVMIMLLKN
jgi:hypothetical protein